MRSIRMLLGTVVAAGLLVAADPMLGTWRLNVEKSKFSPGPGPKALTITYTQEGDWYVMKSVGTAADGTAISRTGRFKTDGGEYAVDGPNGPGKMSVKRSDQHNAVSVTKLDGGGTVTVKTAVSSDGRTRTQTVTGTNSKGETLNHTIVLDKI